MSSHQAMMFLYLFSSLFERACSYLPCTAWEAMPCPAFVHVQDLVQLVIICFPEGMAEVLSWIHLEPVDHHPVFLAVCDNGAFFPGFGCRLTRVLFERTFGSMKSSTRKQPENWKNWSWSKISAFSVEPELWGWQLQVQSSWEMNQYCIAYNHV